MEKYFYGQGRVYLARRTRTGDVMSMRWVGDVSELNVEFSVEKLTHKESYSGQRAVAREFNVGKSGTVKMTLHDFNLENLAFVLYGKTLKIAAGIVTDHALPDTITAGDRFALLHANIDDVTLKGSDDNELVAGVDYEIDTRFGAITFIKTPQNQPVRVDYEHKAAKVTSIFSTTPDDVFFRYEGMNLAESGEPIIVEFYKTQFSPTNGLSLINNDTSLAGLPVEAGIMIDATRPPSAEFGQFGRIINIDEEA